MELEKILQLANQVTDDVVAKIDAEYGKMEKRKGVFEITGKHKATWIKRMTVLFKADGFDVKQLDDSKILVR